MSIQITHKQYRATIEQLALLKKKRTQLNIARQAAITDRRFTDRQEAESTLEQVKEMITAASIIIDTYNAQASIRKAQRMAHKKPDDDLRKKMGGAIRKAATLIRDTDAELYDELDSIINRNGWLQQSFDLQKSHEEQARTIEQLRQRISELEARDTTARQALRQLWDTRYDEVDQFRVDRGIRYRTHIDTDLAQKIKDSI